VTLFLLFNVNILVNMHNLYLINQRFVNVGKVLWKSLKLMDFLPVSNEKRWIIHFLSSFIMWYVWISIINYYLYSKLLRTHRFIFRYQVWDLKFLFLAWDFRNSWMNFKIKNKYLRCSCVILKIFLINF